MKSFLFLSLILCFQDFLLVTAFNPEVVFDAKGKVPFGYNESTGRGPSKWGQLDPAWATCMNGKRQSPIDFDNVTLLTCMGDLNRNYSATNATIMSRGRDIAVNWTGDAGKITINNVDYNLQQIHWHTPSEHTFNGKRYDLELHIVHGSSQGQAAVIGILYRIAERDSLLSKLLPFIETVTKQPTNIGILDPKVIDFGCNSTTFYRYNGSLSAPPCTEGVVWSVLKEVKTVSREQVQALTTAVDYGFQLNARPIQPSNGRSLYLYDPLYISK